MNFQIRAHIALTLLIGASLLHNTEEALMICRQRIISPVKLFQPLTCHQFVWAVSLLSFAILVVYVFAIRTKKTSIYLFLSTAIAAAMLFNAFVPHIIIAVYTLSYTPGLITAVVLNFPLSLVVLNINRKELGNRARLIKFILSGLVIGYLLFAATMLLVVAFI